METKNRYEVNESPITKHSRSKFYPRFTVKFSRKQTKTIDRQRRKSEEEGNWCPYPGPSFR